MAQVYIGEVVQVTVRRGNGTEMIWFTNQVTVTPVRNIVDERLVSEHIEIIFQPVADQPPFVRSDAMKLADAVKSGDEQAALLLADEIIANYTRKDEYVSRKLLLELLVSYQWILPAKSPADDWYCQCCFNKKNQGHKDDCLVAIALGEL